SVSGRISQLYCGLVRERGTLRTSTTHPTCASSSNSTNSRTGRVECPMVKNGCAICPWQSISDARSLALLSCAGRHGRSCRFDFVLRFVLARVVDVSFVIDVLCMHLDDSPADPSGLRVPAYTIMQLESFFHTSSFEDSCRAPCYPPAENSRWLSLPYAIRDPGRDGPGSQTRAIRGRTRIGRSDRVTKTRFDVAGSCNCGFESDS